MYSDLPYAKYKGSIPSFEYSNPTSFFGSRSAIPLIYGKGNAFNFPSGYYKDGKIYNLISNAHEYRSNDFDIVYSSGLKSFGGLANDTVFNAEEVTLKIFLYKADNEID